jgi:hypothetical protein
MITAALAVFFIIRMILPFSLLIALGEWVRRREADYWLQR